VVAQFPDEAGAAAPVHRRNGDKFRSTYGAFAGDIDEAGSTFHGDSGSAARFFYCAKASREDRNDGCVGMAEKPLLWSSGEANPGSFQAEGTKRAAQNNHPTVKPTDLMRWLCRLVTPQGGLILDPFTGSGSTGRGAILEGFRFTGIELDPAYLAIAEARIAAAVEQRRIDTAQLGLFEVAA
jgi:tRNA G10  N-methylase Trm11